MLKWTLIIVGVLVTLVLLAALIGLLIPKQHVAAGRARYRQSAEAIWKAITDFESFPRWREDVKSVGRLPDRDGKPAWVEVSRHGRIPLETVEWDPPRRMVARIADPELPFGGTWTYEITPDGEDAVLTITERGEIYNPIFRFMARVFFGYHATQQRYLAALGRKFGEEVRPEKVGAGE